MMKKLTPDEEERLNKYFSRIKEETKAILEKRWDAKKCAGSAGMLLARFGMNKDPEFAEEGATYILAAVFQTERGGAR